MGFLKWYECLNYEVIEWITGDDGDVDVVYVICDVVRSVSEINYFITLHRLRTCNAPRQIPLCTLACTSRVWLRRLWSEWHRQKKTHWHYKYMSVFLQSEFIARSTSLPNHLVSRFLLRSSLRGSHLPNRLVVCFCGRSSVRGSRRPSRFVSCFRGKSVCGRRHRQSMSSVPSTSTDEAQSLERFQTVCLVIFFFCQFIIRRHFWATD